MCCKTNCKCTSHTLDVVVSCLYMKQSMLHAVKCWRKEKSVFSFQYVLTQKWQDVTHSHLVTDFFFFFSLTSFQIHNHKLAIRPTVAALTTGRANSNNFKEKDNKQILKIPSEMHFSWREPLFCINYTIASYPCTRQCLHGNMIV